MERTSRRRILTGLGTASVVGLAGCSGGTASGASDGATSTDDTGPDSRLGPPVRGNPDAAVTLSVYEDFACPHCKTYQEEGYPKLAGYVEEERIRYEHRDLPIPVLDPGSYEAASAARAVQDRHGDTAFWAYADALFARQEDIRTGAPEVYAEVAAELGYDGDPIQTAAVERAYDPTVIADRQRGIETGLDGTPGFVLDGEAILSGFGDSTIGSLKSALDERLAAASGGGSY